MGRGRGKAGILGLPPAPSLLCSEEPTSKALSACVQGSSVGQARNWTWSGSRTPHLRTPGSCPRPPGGSEGGPDPERPMVSSCGPLGWELSWAAVPQCPHREIPLGSRHRRLASVLLPVLGSYRGRGSCPPSAGATLSLGAELASASGPAQGPKGLPETPWATNLPYLDIPPAPVALVLTMISDPRQAEGRLWVGHYVKLVWGGGSFGEGAIANNCMCFPSQRCLVPQAELLWTPAPALCGQVLLPGWEAESSSVPESQVSLGSHD